LADIEVICVDDGSLDRSREVADEFAAADPRFRVVAQENQGLGPARNTGVAAASGEYLTFVDSDDLVTRTGFARMVRSLDRSGSSFAAGNARRFNNSSGARQSWTHRVAFAEKRIATHVTEFPVLARDRMVWNKVYRRTFWDEQGYRFPAIRYEDYPVTLKAHCEAVTVDVHADPVYFWRERESGDSITQLRFRHDNLHDRVTSAEMVLDDLDPAFRAVRLETENALAEADLLTIYQSFGTVPDDEADFLLGLGARLADRISPEVHARRHVYDRIQLHALRARDVPLLRELARYRAEVGLSGRARAERHPWRPRRLEFPFPGRGRRGIPRSLYAVPWRQVSLGTSVTTVGWTGRDLVVRGTAEIRHVPTTERARVRVRFGRGRSWADLPVQRFTTEDSHLSSRPVGVEVVVPHGELLALARAGEPLGSFVVSVTEAGRYSENPLRGPLDGARWAPGAAIDDDTWAQPTTTTRGELVVALVQDLPQLTGVDVDGDDLLLDIRMPDPQPATGRVLSLPGNRHSPAVSVPAVTDEGDPTRLRARLRAPDVVAGVVEDDPFMPTNTRPLELDPLLGEAEPAEPGLVEPAGPATSVGPVGAAEPAAETVLWVAPHGSRTVRHDDHLVSLTRSPAGRVNVLLYTPRLIADEATVDTGGQDGAGRLTVSGPVPPGSDPVSVVWRWFHGESDDADEVAPEVEVDDAARRWRAVVDVARLLDIPADGSDLSARIGRWSLFEQRDGEDHTVRADQFLLGSLPVRATHRDREALVRAPGQILHLDVHARSHG
ncbi:MAG: glycosyltransferase, partial [Phycicoccus sp.]